MDKISMENWQKVKDAMEASGNTDNFYYKRACAILRGQKDPIDALTKPTDDWSCMEHFYYGAPAIIIYRILHLLDNEFR